MFVVLQICPQAIGPEDLHDPIDVVGVDVFARTARTILDDVPGAPPLSVRRA